MGKNEERRDREVSCPVCDKVFRKSFLPHLRSAHPEEWQSWRESFIAMLESGASLQQIGRHYNISWTVVEREVKKMLEQETSPASKAALQTIVDNFGLAEETLTPMCQDTGIHIYYVNIGENLPRIMGIENILRKTFGFQ